MTRHGAEMAQAIAAKDRNQLVSLFADPLVFRAVTPGRFWEATTPAEVADLVLGTWFEPDETVTGVMDLETDTVADVHKVTYRFSLETGSGPAVVEQVAYYSLTDGLVSQMRVVCSGFRPA